MFFGGPAASAASGVGTQMVRWHLPALASQLSPIGPLAATNRLNLAISLPVRDPEALARFLQGLYDPAGTNYHRYLTPDQFTASFGPTEADYLAVIKFARANGLEVTATHSNRLLLDVSGSVLAVENALHVKMHTYRHPSENRVFFAPDRAPSLDLATPILGISGLDNYSLPHPHLLTEPLISAPNATPNAGSGPNGSFSGQDFRAAYVPDSILTGTGQAVGLLQFDGYTPSDIAYYETQAGLPSVPLQNVLVDGFNGNPTGSGGEIEVSLDIEMAISMAPGLSKVIVYMAGPAGNWHDILNRIANDNLARQISCSWYIPNGPADPVADQIFQQMAAQGQTFFTASGDYDAYTGPINFPNATPYITQVGGTFLTTTGPKGPRVSETTWNRGNGIGTGGGIATQYAIPSWQTNISMTANLGSTTRRNIPDVALTADNVYVRANFQDYRVGGTSCASPLWAGFAALVNQQAATVGQPAIGFINPALDAIGTGATYSSTFNDITTGNNFSPFSPSKFPATNGYDLCTGWGTPAGQNLINALADPEPLLITPQTGFTSAGAVGGPFTATFQTFTLTNAGTNSLTWSLANTSVWMSASSMGGTLLRGGPSTTVTVSLNPAASNLVVGLYPATLWFTNLTDASGQSRACALSVITPPVITVQPTNLTALEGQTVVFSLTATGGLPLAYQWQYNGTNLSDHGAISGSTTTNLVLANVAATQVGNYSVILTNAAGVVTSTPALLAIPPSPPVFTLQPTNQTFYVRQTAQFTVVVVGTEPYTYQWTFNTTNLPGATNATLTLPNLQLAQSGDYAVRVSNSQGSTNSATAVLTVNPPPPCAPVFAGLADWWAGEGNANDTAGLNNGTLVGGVSFANGEVGQAFLFDGSSGYVSIPDSPSLDSFVTNITVELWLKVNQTTPNSDWRGIVAKGNTSWRLQGVQGAGTINFAANGVSTDLSGNYNVNDGLWHHVAAVYDGTNIYIYVDGSLDASKQASGLIIQNTFPVCLGENPDAPHPYFFNGLVDEVSLYHRALTANEIELIYIAGVGGKCPLPIVITSQPTNEIASIGNSATLTVIATGPPPLIYQWSFNGTNLAGATNSTLVLTNVQLANSGIYAVTVANPNGSVTSSNAVLTVVTQPPFIATQPASQTNFAGYTATFSVTAGGSQPLNYQWSFNGTSLVGATNAALNLNNLQPAQSGNYTVTVSNAYGSTNSAIAVLTVSPLPPCTPAPAGIVDWWAGENNANDSIGINNGNLVGGASFAPGKVGQAFLFDGSSGYVSIPDSPSLDSFVTSITIELWLKVNQTTPNADWRGIVSKGNPSWRLQGVQGAGTLDFAANGLSTDLAGNRNVNDGQWHHVAAVYDSTNIYLYIDGTLDASTPATGLIAQTRDPVYLGASPDAPNPYFFNGLVDEISLYNRPLSAAEIQAIYTAGSHGKCLIQLAITTQPTNQTVSAGAGATFVVAATGPEPISYQWTFNGTGINAATNSVLTLTNVQPANAGIYAVMVSNLFTRVTSSNALLTVFSQPPIITTQPMDQTNLVGSTVSFSVMATGALPLSYQWSFNLFNITGATNATLTLTNIQPGQAGNYSVQVSNVFGTTNSTSAVLAVNSPPSCAPISAGMIDWWAGEGNANDSVGTNSGTLVGGASFAPGEVGQAFLFDGSSGYVSIPDSPSLDSFVTNITIETWIKVNQTTPNADWSGIVTKGNSSWRLQGVQGAGTVNFAATGVNAILYGNRNVNDRLWHHVAGVYDSTNIYLYVDGTLDASLPAKGLIAQNNNPVYLGANPEAPNPYFFNGLIDEVSVYNRPLSASEIQAIYAAGSNGKCPLQLAITAQPTNQIVNIFSNATFAVAATGPQPLSYQWTFNGTGINAATNSVLTLTNVQPANAGIYAVVVSNFQSSITSSNALLTVVSPPPVIISQPNSQTNLIGTTVSFSVTASGAQPLKYQWSFNLVNIPGATNATLSLTNVQLAQAGNYSVQVSNAYGSTNSLTAFLAVYQPPCVSAPAGLVDWWAGEGSASDGIGNNNGTLIGGASYAAGEVGQAFLFNGSSGYVSIPDSPSLDTFATNITIELWLKVNQTNANVNSRGIVTKGNSSWRLQGTSGAKTVNFAANGVSSNLSGNRNINDRQWHHVAAVYDGSHIYLYVDGTLDASTPATGFIYQNRNPVALGNLTGASGSSYFNGLEDEVSLYNRPLSAAEIQQIYLAGSSGKCPVPVAITTQPTNQTANVATNVAFVVGAVGSKPLNYQWSFNGTNLSGATNGILLLTNVQPANAGNYAVTISNAVNSLISSNALLTVLTYPPTILTQPASQTNFATTTATFNVSAGGSPPLSYQWTFNTTNLPGATNATLILSNLQPSQAGDYAVTVASPYGSTNSATAILTVNLVPSCAPISAGLVSWWAGEGNAIDNIGTNNGILVGGASYAPGEVGQAFLFDGSSGYVSIPDSPSLDSFVTNITIETWIKVNQTTPNADWRGIVTKGNSSWRLQGVQGANTINFAANGLSANLSGNRNVNDGQWHHVAAVYDGTNIYLYVDSTLDASTPATGLINQTSDPLALGNNTGSYSSYFFNGLVDEVSLYNRPLSAQEIQLIYVVGSSGKCPVPVTITTQPTNQTATAGDAVTLAVSATGSQPLNYQWAFNGTNLPGTTNSVLTLTNVQPTNAGNYAVTVSNAFGPVISSNALVTVLTYPPTILMQPTSQTNIAGTTATFSVTAGGTLPLSYQWMFNAANLNGATNSTLILTNVQLDQAGIYSVQVSSPYGSTNSAIVTLVVNPAPSCDPAPTGLVDWWTGEGNANDSIGMNNGTLVGGATYAPGEVGQAFLFDGISGYVSIPDSPSLDSFVTNITIEAWIKVNQMTPNADWRGIVTKGNSSWRLQGVQGAGSINFYANGLTTDVTGNQNVNDGQWHHVAAVYDGSYTYLYVDGTLDASKPVTGSINQTSDPVAIGNNTGGSGAYFFNGLVDEVSLYNRPLSANEIQAIYAAGIAGKCPPNPPLIVSQPSNAITWAHSTVSFAVTAAGSPPLAFQWSFNGTNLLAGTNSTLTLTNVQMSQAGNYAVLVTNNYGSILSSNATLVITQLYHFVWSLIPSPRFANSPFAVGIQAQNSTNGLATNFTGTVALQSTNGIPILPATSSIFVQGVWTGNVSVAQTATNLVLVATDTLGDFGVANPVNIVELPTLTTAFSGGTLLLYWPVSPSGFLLETTPDLTLSNWLHVTTPPFQIGNQNLLSIPTSGTNAFYRLRFPGP